MRTMPETAAITARITSPSCAIWPLISCPRNPPKAPCVSKSNGPAGRTPTSQSSSPKSEMRLPWRPLGIPAISDRVAQMAALLVIGPIFETDLLANQYGFRPEMDAKMAIRRAFWHITDHGRTEVADLDLKDYFNTIPHGPLMRCVARRIADGTVLAVIKAWLTVPIIERDKRGMQQSTGARDSNRGTPQGGVVSPLLANLYFRRFLLAWNSHGHRDRLGVHVVNYADDFVICCRPGNGEAALATMRHLMTRLGLTVNEAKTRLIRIPDGSCDFLGYTIGHFHGRDGGAYIGTRPSRKAVRALLRKIHDATTPQKHADTPGRRDQQLAARLGRVLQPRPCHPDLRDGAPVYRAARPTLVDATSRSERHRVPPVPGRVSLPETRPLRPAAPTCRPAEREGLTSQVKAGCRKSARPV